MSALHLRGGADAFEAARSLCEDPCRLWKHPKAGKRSCSKPKLKSWRESIRYLSSHLHAIASQTYASADEPYGFGFKTTFEKRVMEKLRHFNNTKQKEISKAVSSDVGCGILSQLGCPERPFASESFPLVASVIRRTENLDTLANALCALGWLGDIRGVNVGVFSARLTWPNNQGHVELHGLDSLFLTSSRPQPRNPSLSPDMKSNVGILLWSDCRTGPNDPCRRYLLQIYEFSVKALPGPIQDCLRLGNIRIGKPDRKRYAGNPRSPRCTSQASRYLTAALCDGTDLHHRSNLASCM